MTPYYQDDHVTIYHGDCREVTEWLSGDVMVTDPPYGIGWHKGDVPRANRRAMSRRHAGIRDDHDTSVRDAALALWGTRPGVVFASFDAPAPPHCHLLVWQKPNDAGVIGSTTGWRRDLEAVYLTGRWPRRSAAWSSVLRSTIPNIGNPSSPAGQTGHPHAKPLDLMRDLIKKSPDGIVSDPFAGSGSTLRAAKDLGRRAIGVEIDERYCEIAARRMGQEAMDFGGTA